VIGGRYPTRLCSSDSSALWTGLVVASAAVNSAYERDVAPAPGDEPAVGQLLPVIESPPRVVRPFVEELGQRLGGDHLTSGGPHDVVELRDQPARVAVRGDHDMLGIELVQRRDALAFTDLRSRLGRPGRQTTDPARWVERAVFGVEDRGVIGAGERLGQLVDPFHREPVREQRFVLGSELVSLLFVCGQPEAADTPERVAGEPSHPIERALGRSPERSCTFRPEPGPGDVVVHGAATEGKAAVPPTRAGGDRARLVETNPFPGVGQRERAGTARDASADDRDIDGTLEAPSAQRLSRLVQPEGRLHAPIVDTVTAQPGTRRRLPRRGLRAPAPSAPR
jgi:hypothetical protein